MGSSHLAPLLVIVGETASGKTALSLEIAKKWHGEVICADSRTIYRGMNIGTAKPSILEQQEVAHHLIDIVDPDEPFSAAMFKEKAQLSIREVHSRGKLPIVVGGSGMYINALIYDYSFRESPDPMKRKELEALSVEQLQDALERKGIPLPSNAKNPRHLIRNLEAGQAIMQQTKLPDGVFMIGLRQNLEVLSMRIRHRAEKMIEEGLLGEAEELYRTFGYDLPSMQAPAYRSFRGFIEHTKTYEQSFEDFITADLRLAKKQRTWFKRDQNIIWCSGPGEATNRVEEWLATFSKQDK